MTLQVPLLVCQIYQTVYLLMLFNFVRTILINLLDHKKFSVKQVVKMFSFKQLYQEIPEDLNKTCSFGKLCSGFGLVKYKSFSSLDYLCFECFNSLKDLTIEYIDPNLTEICHHQSFFFDYFSEESHNCILCQEELETISKGIELDMQIIYYGYPIFDEKGFKIFSVLLKTFYFRSNMFKMFY